MYREEPKRMHVEEGDWRPPSVLRVAWMTGAAWIGGLGLSGTLALALGIALALYAMGVEILPDDEQAAPLVEEEEVVAARFVQLGREFREELPNRNVPLRSTAPPDTTAISENPRERQEMPDAGPRPPDPMEDPLQRLVNRADLFAEIAEEQEREGSPDGIEEGTETEATEGNVYAGRIYGFFRRGWSVPETIGDQALQDLSIEVTIEVGEDLEIVRFRLRGESGNPDFDQSVVAQLERLKASDATIPEPPILVRPQYVGAPFTLRFRGRHAGR